MNWSRLMQSRDIIVCLSNGINKFMKNSFLLIDLLLTNIALWYQIIVFSLIFEISQIYFIHYSCIILFKELHISHKILLMVLENNFHSFFATFVLGYNKLISFGLSAWKKCFKLLFHKEILINGQEILVFRFFINNFSCICCINSIFKLLHL
jgi:hypothetical protein